METTQREWTWILSETHRKDEFHKSTKRELIPILQNLYAKLETVSLQNEQAFYQEAYTKTKYFYLSL